MFSNDKIIAGDVAQVLALPPARPIDMLVGQRLAQLRGLNGLTICALSAALDIPPQSITSYETGAVPTPTDALIDITRFYQVPLVDLIAGTCNCNGRCERATAAIVDDSVTAIQAATIPADFDFYFEGTAKQVVSPSGT